MSKEGRVLTVGMIGQVKFVDGKLIIPNKFISLDMKPIKKLVRSKPFKQ